MLIQSNEHTKKTIRHSLLTDECLVNARCRCHLAVPGATWQPRILHVRFYIRVLLLYIYIYGVYVYSIYVRI